jgi:L-fuculose-phosphate aldolase
LTASDDSTYLAERPGPPIGDDEGRIIHEALGDKRASLLAHHEQLVATGTIEQAEMLAVFIERTARMQVLAQSMDNSSGQAAPDLPQSPIYSEIP